MDTQTLVDAREESYYKPQREENTHTKKNTTPNQTIQQEP